jgi:hypothetical protein
MSWTYSEDPNTSPKDYVRFLIGDTDREEPLISDQEIIVFLNNYNQGVIMSAIRCCETIAAKFSRRVNESVGQVKMDFSQAAKAYREMALDLRRRGAIEDMKPYAGGISISDKLAQDSNTDRVKPDFTKQMMDNNQVSPFTSIGQDTDPLQDTNVP